tara:strand:+ start:995 stop:1261 length:267 start_codon:yes stop_codon:yes gene_type:complete
MIIYCTNGYSKKMDGTFEEEMEDHHFSNKEDAIGKAKEMQFGTVSRIDIGNVDKACVIAMLNQRQFAESYVTIWMDGEYIENKEKGTK